MTTLRLILLAFVALLSGSTSLLAGPTYSATFGPSPGSSLAYGNAYFNGPNNLGGTLNAIGANGILGTNTPLNSGQVFSETALQFSVYGNTGQVNINLDFLGTIIESNINALGGTAEFVGYLSNTAASFFGVSASTEQIGTLTLELSPAAMQGAGGNFTASAQLSFGPGAAVPEPSSLLLLLIGCLGGVARTGLTRWRAG